MDRLYKLYFEKYPNDSIVDYHLYHSLFNLGIIVTHPELYEGMKKFQEEEYELACSILEDGRDKEGN